MIHVLKVIPPYFDALADGSKTFEVRRNDRGFQCGDTLELMEWDTTLCGSRWCAHQSGICPAWTGRVAERTVGFVYSGDPRLGGIEPGFVVLALLPTGGSDAA